MKRVFTLLLSLLALQYAQLNGQACQGVFDDFEAPTLNPAWQFGTGVYTRTLTTTNPGVGTQSFEHTGSSSFYQGTYQLFTPAQPTYISWWAKTANTTVANGYFVAGSSNISSDNGILFCYFNSTSGLRFFASTGYNHPITANTWYHIEVFNINYTARTMDIAVNGTTILTAWPFRSTTATQFDRVHLFNLSTATATYDNIQIGFPGPGVDSLMIVDVPCAGDTTGQINLATVGGTPPYTYAWSSGQTTEDLTGLSAGVYTLSITDSQGCVDQDSFAVAEPAQLTNTGTVLDNICPGQSAGSISVSPSGGTPGYTYLWSNGDSIAMTSGLPAGTYSVVVTDSNGCSISDSFMVNSPANWSLGAQIVDNLCFGDQTGTISLSVSGATPSYTYLWSTGDTLDYVLGLGAGGYSVIITDSMGCMTQDSFNVAEPSAVGIASSTVSDEVSTGTLGAIDITVAGGTPGYTFSWSNGESTEDISGLSAGTYTVTITDANGCTYTEGFTVDFIVSLDQAWEGVQFHAYPNPFGRNLTIEWNFTEILEAQLSLTDVQGRVIRTAILDEQSGGRMEWQMEIPAGVYFLHLQSGERRATQKLISQ